MLPESCETSALTICSPNEEGLSKSKSFSNSGLISCIASIAERTENHYEPAASSPTTKLEHALKTAISAAHNAEKFGTELGYVVRFDADAIKSMAITVLINMTQQGARR